MDFVTNEKNIQSALEFVQTHLWDGAGKDKRVYVEGSWFSTEYICHLLDAYAWNSYKERPAVEVIFHRMRQIGITQDDSYVTVLKNLGVYDFSEGSAKAQFHRKNLVTQLQAYFRGEEG